MKYAKVLFPSLLVLLMSSFFAPIASAQSVIATVNVGSSPNDVAYDSGKGDIFVTKGIGTTVSVISDSNNTIVATIPIGSTSNGIAYDSGKGEVFVAGTTTVSVISDSTNTVVAKVPVGSNPYGVAYDSGKGEVFVTNFNSNSVSVISDRTNTVVATIPVGSGPYGVAYDSGRGEVFVTNEEGTTVSVISDSNNTVVATIPVGLGPNGITYDSGKGEVFVAAYPHNVISVISDSTNAVVGSPIIVGNYPAAVEYDSARGEIFAGWGKCCVSVISDSNNTVVGSPITVGSLPIGIAYDSNREEMFVSNSGDTTVSVIADSFSSCLPPASGDWTISSNCILSGNSTSQANVIVQNNSVLMIPAKTDFGINFADSHLLVKSGSGVLIKSGGKITSSPVSIDGFGVTDVAGNKISSVKANSWFNLPINITNLRSVDQPFAYEFKIYNSTALVSDAWIGSMLEPHMHLSNVSQQSRLSAIGSYVVHFSVLQSIANPKQLAPEQSEAFDVTN